MGRNEADDHVMEDRTACLNIHSQATKLDKAQLLFTCLDLV